MFCLTPPLILTPPPFINFSKSLKPPRLFWSPPFIMNLRVPVPVISRHDKFLRVVHLQGQKKSLKQRESSSFCDRFYTEDFKNWCASSRYATATFDFKFLAHFEWDNLHFFTEKSSSCIPLINWSIAWPPYWKQPCFHAFIDLLSI